MRLASSALALAVAAVTLLAVACGSSEDDGATTGDDQNVEEVPCAPLATIKCRPGYHTISLLNCPPDQGRCSVDACEPTSTLRCAPGYEQVSSGCKGKGVARCSAKDGGAGSADASKDGGDASQDARHD